MACPEAIIPAPSRKTLRVKFTGHLRRPTAIIVFASSFYFFVAVFFHCPKTVVSFRSYSDQRIARLLLICAAESPYLRDNPRILDIRQISSEDLEVNV